ncbi:hypothetical protein L2725_16380 [Shewanella corallii]|uniref:Uncharacterized protein n=1 Tax=Shewanella corallii TaxID=560080 RepID=A0ABT0NAE6_9GAMM|nr:hypothetical protein [Shewanella corallii]MCL2915332.1 hypothetical protein [Shewanella corallii]
MTAMLSPVPHEILDAAIEFFNSREASAKIRRINCQGGKRQMEPQQLVGEWLDNRDGEGDKINVYRSGGEWVLESWSEDGCHSRDKMLVTETEQGLKLEDRGGNLFGEYFLLQDGKLSVCNAQGCMLLERA